MKTRSTLSIIILLIASCITYSQNPHFVREYPGIPVMAQSNWSFQNSVHQQAKQMGVDIFWDRVEDINDNMNVIIGNNLDFMPISVRNNSGVRFNWIEYYCDAKYTAWEAEGTDTLNVGKATLERDKKRTEVIPGEGVIRIKPEYAGTVVDSMIYGPYYYQEKEYIAYREETDPKVIVTYDVNFRLRLQRNSAYPHDTLTENMNDEICKLLVTYSKIVVDSSWRIESTTTIDSIILKRGDFPILNQFDTTTIIYNLSNVPHGGNRPDNYYTRMNRPGIEGGINGPENIEFKVVWLGNPKYLLSVDKITVSDIRGRDLVADTLETRARFDIKRQMVLLLLTYQDHIVGWWGIDEPYSIDNFEPIKIVAQTLRNHQPQQQIYLPFMGHWDGVWHDSYNPFGTNHINCWDEFSKRTTGL